LEATSSSPGPTPEFDGFSRQFSLAVSVSQVAG